MELGHTTPVVMEAIASVLLALQVMVLSPLKEVPLVGHVPVQTVVQARAVPLTENLQQPVFAVHQLILV
jgi:hypothetical protein